LFALSDLEAALASGASKIVLELHQDELVRVLDPLVDYMNAGGEVVNDPRTVLIAHDKRLLSVLTDKSIMRDHVDRDTVEKLQRFVIRTRVSGMDRRRIEATAAARDRWVAKKGISGKTDGLVLGNLVTGRQWSSVLNKPDFVLQKRLPQLDYRTWHPEFRENRIGNLAGTLPIIDGTSFGPGLYRLFSPDTCKFFGLAQPVRRS
jgi:hypothetical protein